MGGIFKSTNTDGDGIIDKKCCDIKIQYKQLLHLIYLNSVTQIMTTVNSVCPLQYLY